MSDDPAALLAALRLQHEWGAEEALAAAPPDRSAPVVVAPPPAVRRPKSVAVVAPAASASAGLAAGAADLEALREAIRAFDTPLRETATNLVFSDGVAESGLMLVGEAPGADEDRLGKPFVGVSGQLLDRMFASLGLTRQRDFYLANILPWRPPGNRTPSDAEIALFLPFMMRHIALVRPRHLLLLGGTATKALLGAREGITRLRGRWRSLEVTPDYHIPVMPTLHPAYLLRNPIAKREAWADLLALREALAAPNASA